MSRPARLAVLGAGVALACLLAGAAGSRTSPPRPGELRAIDPPAGPGAMAPNLTLAGDDVLMTWLEPGPAAPGSKSHRLRFARRTGDRWTPPVTIVEGGDFFANWADFPAIAAGPRGDLLAHWLAKTGPDTYAYAVNLARSSDGGATWTRLGLLHDDGTPTEHGFVSFVPATSGVQAFWLDGRATGKDGGAMSLRAALVGSAVGAGEVLDPRVCECCQTDAAMTSEGPVVVYRDRSSGEVRDVAIIRRTGSGWSRPATVHADGWKIPGCPVNGPAVAAAGRKVAVAWFTGAPGPRVQVAFSNDAGATFGPARLVDGEGPLGRVDLVLDGNGEAIVSWFALDGGNAAVRLRRMAPNGAAGEPLSVARTSTARSSGFPRLLRTDDRLVLAWVDGGEATRLRAAEVPLAAVPAVSAVGR